MAHSKHLCPPAQGVTGVAIATEENLRLGAVPWFRNPVNAMAGGHIVKAPAHERNFSRT